MNISLPKSLKFFVEDRVASSGYSSSSEYVREPIRKDRDRQLLRARILEGAASPSAGMADADYFERLRRQLHEAGR